MAIYNIAPLPISTDNGWETGYIDTYGNHQASGSCMTSPYIPVLSGFSVYVTFSYPLPSNTDGLMGVIQYNSNKSMIDRGFYDSDTNSIPSATITLNSNTKYIRVWSRFTQNQPNASCTVNVNYPWTMGTDELPTNPDFIDNSQYAMTTPYPKGLWRVTPELPYPWHELLPMEIGLEPLPLNTQGPAQEITDTSSIEYRRYANTSTGYANPNLYRFQDVPFPENVRCSVGIYGTDSYQFTEVILHDEESTTSEIP